MFRDTSTLPIVFFSFSFRQLCVGIVAFRHRYSFQLEKEAAAIENACETVLRSLGHDLSKVFQKLTAKAVGSLSASCVYKAY